MHDGEFPESIDQCRVWHITGSRCSVYEKQPWMLWLEAFIRQLYQEDRKLVGVCFGHQIMAHAHALGGLVELSEKGWGVGLSVNQVITEKQWMHPEARELRVLVSHRDQIIRFPEMAEVLVFSDFCPYYLVQYGPHLLSIQGHPEFSKDYSSALMNLRKGFLIPEDVVARGQASLVDEDNNKLTNIWIVNFLNSV